jgi:hypothetical protein
VHLVPKSKIVADATLQTSIVLLDLLGAFSITRLLMLLAHLDVKFFTRSASFQIRPSSIAPQALYAGNSVYPAAPPPYQTLMSGASAKGHPLANRSTKSGLAM